MPVALLPPLTRSLWRTPRRAPLAEGPRYIRGRDSTRWHRVRSAFQYDESDRITWRLWCTNGGIGAQPITADEVPVSDDVCGPCVGKALGAGQDELPTGLPSLRFDPRWLTPPSICPGSSRESMFIPAGNRVGQCKACGEVLPTRASGGGAYGPCSRYGVIKHKPSPNLVEPCPWHAWMYIVARGSAAGCSCGWTGAADLMTASTRWEDAT